LQRLRLIAPKLEEQERVAQFCDSLDTQIDNYSIYVRKLQTQKPALMQRLLTGEVRV
jgi:restriction endonuclease S subunit